MNASGMPLATYVLLVVNIVASLVAFSQPAVFSALAFQVGPVMDGAVLQAADLGVPARRNCSSRI